jgi:hypothetical protein
METSLRDMIQSSLNKRDSERKEIIRRKIESKRRKEQREKACDNCHNEVATILIVGTHDGYKGKFCSRCVTNIFVNEFSDLFEENPDNYEVRSIV